MIKKRWKENTPEILKTFLSKINETKEFTYKNLELIIQSILQEKEIGMGQIMMPLRLVLVGSGKGPGVIEIIELLGREEVCNRINTGIEKINT